MLLPSMESIAPLARACADDFRNRELEHKKEDVVLWTDFRLVHDQYSLPYVEDAMHSYDKGVLCICFVSVQIMLFLLSAYHVCLN